METKRLIIWGSFESYEQYLPLFRLEEWKETIEIAAAMFLDENLVRKVDGYPVCTLDDVEIHCNHYGSFEEAQKIWMLRKERINYQNILVKMTIDTEEKLEEFRNIPYRKIGFSTLPAGDEDIIDCSKSMEYILGKYKGFWDFVNAQARGECRDLKYYRILDLLLEDENYQRTR